MNNVLKTFMYSALTVIVITGVSGCKCWKKENAVAVVTTPDVTVPETVSQNELEPTAQPITNNQPRTECKNGSLYFVESGSLVFDETGASVSCN